MQRNALIAVLVACLLLGLVQPGVGGSVNGGLGCKYYNPAQITQLMLGKGITDVVQIQAMLDSLKATNGYLCKSCMKTRMQLQRVGDLVDGRGECWCADGYGYYESAPNPKTGYIKRAYGCNLCPSPTTTDPTAGPYNSVKKNWSGTPCA